MDYKICNGMLEISGISKKDITSIQLKDDNGITYVYECEMDNLDYKQAREYFDDLASKNMYDEFIKQSMDLLISNDSDYRYKLSLCEYAMDNIMRNIKSEKYHYSNKQYKVYFSGTKLIMDSIHTGQIDCINKFLFSPKSKVSDNLDKILSEQSKKKLRHFDYLDGDDVCFLLTVIGLEYRSEVITV